jgi:hypothetical protein
MKELARRVRKMETARPDAAKTAGEMTSTELMRAILQDVTPSEADELDAILARTEAGHATTHDDARFTAILVALRDRLREGTPCD